MGGDGKTRKHVVTKKPATQKRIVYPWIRSPIFAVEEMQLYGINTRDFSIYLAGEEKVYYDEDASFTEPGIEYQMATRFIKNLHTLSGKNPRRPILTHMKTCGGSWEEGMAIYDAIKACPNPITILSYTHARSMSSIVLQAADKRVLMPNSYFLFHEGTLGLSGTNKGVLSNAEWVKKIVNPTMVRIYVSVLKRRGRFSKWSAKRISEMLRDRMDKKEDVFLSAWEAVDWGFADEVFGGADGHFDWEKLRVYERENRPA